MSERRWNRATQVVQLWVGDQAESDGPGNTGEAVGAVDQIWVPVTEMARVSSSRPVVIMEILKRQVICWSIFVHYVHVLADCVDDALIGYMELRYVRGSDGCSLDLFSSWEICSEGDLGVCCLWLHSVIVFSVVSGSS